MNFITQLIAFLLTFGAGEAEDAGGEDHFLGGDDGDDDGEGADDADDAAEDADDDGDDSDEEEEADDEELEDDDDDDADEAEDDDDDDEEVESEDDPESEGEGDDEGGAAASALRHAIRARLEVARNNAPDNTFNVEMPSVEDIMAEPGMDDLNKDDVKTIHAIASTVVERTLASYNKVAVEPMRTTQTETARKNRLIADLQTFSDKYPDALKTHQTAMAEIWDAFAKEFGRDGADSVTFEELYVMTGGRGKAAASRKSKGVAKRVASKQKRKGMRASNQAGRVGKVRTRGGKRSRSKDDEILQQTQDHIRKTHFVPFTMD